MIDRLKSFKNNKAFTLIELIVVIAVIGILILLAAPKFLGYTKDAKLAQIKNDVRAVESAIEIELVRAEVDDVDKLEEWNWSTVENDKMQEYVDEGSLFDRKGTVGELDQDEFYAVDKGDISVKSKLKGNFIYATGGKVFYQDDGVSDESGSGEETEGETEEIEVPKGFTLLTDDDFEFIEVSHALNEYKVDGETAKGYFHYKGEADKVVIPHEIMENEVKDYYRMFYNNGTDGSGTTVTAIVSDNLKVTDMSSMFSGSQATELDLSLFNTKNVTNINSMFSGSGGYVSNGVINSSHVKEVVGIEDWNLSSLKTLDNVFEYSPIENVPDIVKSWGDNGYLDNVASYRGLFETGGFKGELDVGSIFQNVDTSKVTDMRYMFSSSQATSLTGLDKFDTSNVTDMNSMFSNSQADSLTFGGKFDTSNVMNMRYMFSNSQATELDLSGFDTSKVADMSSMFSGSQADSLNLNSFNTEKVTDMRQMFSGSQATKLDLSTFNTEKVTDMSWMFQGSHATELDLSTFDTGKVTDMSLMFSHSQANPITAKDETTANKFIDEGSADSSRVTWQ